jgi:hypothetical protein
MNIKDNEAYKLEKKALVHDYSRDESARSKSVRSKRQGQRDYKG